MVGLAKSPRVEPWIKGTDNLTQRKTQGAGIVKGWEDQGDRGHIPDTFK